MKLLGLLLRDNDDRVPDTLTISESSSSVRSSSLGSGGYSFDGKLVEQFAPRPPSSCRKSRQDDEQHVVIFTRSSSSFLRVTDLALTSFSSDDSSVPNFHNASVDPPPGVERDVAEKWVALDDGEGQHAPIAPYAIDALCHSASTLTLHNSSLWTPESKTAKILAQPDSWEGCTWSTNLQEDACWKLLPAPGSPRADQVLVWSGTFPYTGYGSELPAIRASGIIPMSADALRNLLVDSDRVHTYNKLSLGRKDVLVLQQDQEGPFGGVTKIMKSESRLMRKTLHFTSLLHARETAFGHVIVTRAVEDGRSEGGFLKSEILLGVNVIWRLPDNRCLLVSVNHIRSPILPMMIAKRIGLQAAINFVQDLRAVAMQS
jgi:hypothetical protein